MYEATFWKFYCTYASITFMCLAKTFKMFILRNITTTHVKLKIKTILHAGISLQIVINLRSFTMVSEGPRPRVLFTLVRPFFIDNAGHWSLFHVVQAPLYRNTKLEQ